MERAVCSIPNCIGLGDIKVNGNWLCPKHADEFLNDAIADSAKAIMDAIIGKYVRPIIPSISNSVQTTLV